MKIYTSLTEDEMAAVIEGAHAAGLRVTGHLGGSVTTRRAIEMGIDGLEHGIFAIRELTDVPQTAPIADQYCALAAVDLDTPVARGLIDAIVAEGVWVTLEIQLDFVSRIHRAGGRVVTGTDPVLPSLTPGPGLHAEMANLVRAGFTPVEAIRAATMDGAIALGIDDRLGSIEVGKLADLMVVRGGPAQSIADVGKTVWVFKAGGRIDPTAMKAAAKRTIRLPAVAPPPAAPGDSTGS